MKFSYVDAHCDTAVWMMRNNRRLNGQAGHIDKARAVRMGRYAQFFAFCTTCWDAQTEPELLYQNAFRFFERELAENADWIVSCGNRSEVESAWTGGRCAALYSLEGAEAIACDPGRLEQARRDGVRMASLTWNGENALAGSHVTGGGLTAQGREFVRRAQALGIAVDVSHISDQAFYDILDITEKPIVASHSDSRAVCENSRNLTDDMFRLIVETGGCVGLNLYGDFLNGGAPTLDGAYRHLSHFLELGGDGHICLGGDWDGIDSLPEQMRGVDGWMLLPPYLRERGFSDDVLDRLTSGALLRMMDDVGMRGVEK